MYSEGTEHAENREFLQGPQGVKLILDVSSISQNTAMDPRKSFQNIEIFERRIEILQRLRIMKNADDIVTTEVALHVPRVSEIE